MREIDIIEWKVMEFVSTNGILHPEHHYDTLSELTAIEPWLL